MTTEMIISLCNRCRVTKGRLLTLCYVSKGHILGMNLIFLLFAAPDSCWLICYAFYDRALWVFLPPWWSCACSSQHSKAVRAGGRNVSSYRTGMRSHCVLRADQKFSPVVKWVEAADSKRLGWLLSRAGSASVENALCESTEGNNLSCMMKWRCVQWQGHPGVREVYTVKPAHTSAKLKAFERETCTSVCLTARGVTKK